MISGIYKIVNLITAKCYIGSAAVLKNRCYEHKRLLLNNKHPNRHLQFAWNKYGEEAFRFEIIEFCEKDKLIEREQYWIDYLDCCKNGYNLSPTANSQLGFRHSEETKKKISLRAKNISEETRTKMKQHVFSEEHKQNMSIARKKRITKDETRLKMSKSQKKRHGLTLDDIELKTPIVIN